MKPGRWLRARALGLLLGPRAQATRRSFADLRRRIRGAPQVVEVFLGLEDPYSYLLTLYLGDLADSYDIELRCHLTEPRNAEFRPNADLRAVYALEDCRRIAAELGVPLLDRGAAPPVEHRRALIEALVEDSTRDPQALFAGLAQYWRGDAEAVARRVSDVDPGSGGVDQVAANQARLAKLGHYDTAMLYFGGEWFWGVDRLPHVTDRLDALGLRHAGSTSSRLASIRQATSISLPVTPPSAARDLAPLELFFSFRSSYSYLALDRVYAIADAYRLELRLRPVLPMVTRGAPLPAAKLRYLLTDAAREAARLDLPFGRIADPIGVGVDRLMAVFFYAREERRERDFVRNAAEAVWSRGVDVTTDKGLRKVTGRTGLFWPNVVAALGADAWREEIADNAVALQDAGGCGVPTVRLGDFVAWGQDRCWLLARHVEERCDTGEGIVI